MSDIQKFKTVLLLAIACFLLGMVVLPRLMPQPVGAPGKIVEMAACAFVWFGSMWALFVRNTPKFLQ